MNKQEEDAADNIRMIVGQLNQAVREAATEHQVVVQYDTLEQHFMRGVTIPTLTATIAKVL